jgi:hypothetical protein
MMQCPNCGGYKTSHLRHEVPWGKVIVVTVVGVLLWVIVWPAEILWYFFSYRPKHNVCPQCLYGYYCQLCGYQWLQRPGEILPVNNNPAARAFGQAKLDEEERARQAAAAAYWYNQK